MLGHIYFITIKSSKEGKVRGRGRKTLEQDQSLISALHVLLCDFGALDRVVVEIWYSVNTEQAANTMDGHQGRAVTVGQLTGQGLRSKKQLKSHLHHSARVKGKSGDS